MKIQRINAFFRKFGEFQLRHRVVFLVAICLVTVFCVAGLPKLTLSSNEEDWFDNTEQTKIDSDHFKDLFGADDSVMVLVQADDVFAPDVLEAIGRIAAGLKTKFPTPRASCPFLTCPSPSATRRALKSSIPLRTECRTTRQNLHKRKTSS